MLQALAQKTMMSAKTEPNRTAIVIGGGIAGCSTAYALAQRGIKVTLLERNPDIASEASGNPLGMLYPRLSGDDTSSQFALAGYLHSIALFKTLNLPDDAFNACGMLQLGFNARELARIQKVALQNHANDIIQYVDKSKAGNLAGINIEHNALYLPNAAWVKPQQLCRRLTAHENISTITLNKVMKVFKTNNVFHIVINDHTVLNSDMVIIANANAAQELYPNLPLSTQAVRGQVSLLKATQDSRKLQTIVCSDGYFSPATYQQNAEDLHCLGATFSNVAASVDRQSDLVINEQDHQANLDKLHNISPLLHTSLKNNIAGGRVSLRCSASDYWPLAGLLLEAESLKNNPPRAGAPIGSLPWVSGLYMNVAHGSKGFATAPLCAELIACMICNEPLPISAELAGLLNPNRFLLKEMGFKRLAKMMLTLI